MPAPSTPAIQIRYRDGDAARTWRVRFMSPDGRGADITGWTQIEIVIRRADRMASAETAYALSTVQDDPGIVEFTPSAFALEPGLYEAYFRVTAGGKIITYPNRRTLLIEVIPSL